LIDADRLGWWLCERQLPSGGLNGRPEKLPDVCYSWWVLSTLTILGRLQWLDKEAIVSAYIYYGYFSYFKLEDFDRVYYISILIFFI